MRCLSCQRPLQSGEAARFGVLVVCKPCKELAEKASRDIEASFARARRHAQGWLEQHIMKGGLLTKGAAGEDVVVEAVWKEHKEKK